MGGRRGAVLFRLEGRVLLVMVVFSTRGDLPRQPAGGLDTRRAGGTCGAAVRCAEWCGCRGGVPTPHSAGACSRVEGLMRAASGAVARTS